MDSPRTCTGGSAPLRGLRLVSRKPHPPGTPSTSPRPPTPSHSVVAVAPTMPPMVSIRTVVVSPLSKTNAISAEGQRTESSSTCTSMLAAATGTDSSPRLMAPTRKKLPLAPTMEAKRSWRSAVLGPEAPTGDEAVPAPGSPRVVSPGRRVDLCRLPVELDGAPHPAEDMEVVGEDGPGCTGGAREGLGVGVGPRAARPRSRTRHDSRHRRARNTDARRRCTIRCGPAHTPASCSRTRGSPRHCSETWRRPRW